VNAGWAPELVWTFWRIAKSLAPSGIQTANRPAPRLVTTLSYINSSNAIK